MENVEEVAVPVEEVAVPVEEVAVPVEEVAVPVEEVVVPKAAKYKEPKVSPEELLKQILELRQEIKYAIDTSVQESLIFKLSDLENLYAKGPMVV